MNKHTPGKWTHDSQEALHIRAEDGGLVETLGWSNGPNRGSAFCPAVWNDAPGRTVADVIALCDKVAQS